MARLTSVVACICAAFLVARCPAFRPDTSEYATIEIAASKAGGDQLIRSKHGLRNATMLRDKEDNETEGSRGGSTAMVEHSGPSSSLVSLKPVMDKTSRDLVVVGTSGSYVSVIEWAEETVLSLFYNANAGATVAQALTIDCGWAPAVGDLLENTFGVATEGMAVFAMAKDLRDAYKTFKSLWAGISCKWEKYLEAFRFVNTLCSAVFNALAVLSDSSFKPEWLVLSMVDVTGMTTALQSSAAIFGAIGRIGGFVAWILDTFVINAFLAIKVQGWCAADEAAAKHAVYSSTPAVEADYAGVSVGANHQKARAKVTTMSFKKLAISLENVAWLKAQSVVQEFKLDGSVTLEGYDLQGFNTLRPDNERPCRKQSASKLRCPSYQTCNVGRKQCEYNTPESANVAGPMRDCCNHYSSSWDHADEIRRDSGESDEWMHVHTTPLMNVLQVCLTAACNELIPRSLCVPGHCKTVAGFVFH